MGDFFYPPPERPRSGCVALLVLFAAVVLVIGGVVFLVWINGGFK